VSDEQMDRHRQLREKAEAAVAKIQRAKKLVAGMSQVGALSSRSSMLVL